MDISDHIEDFWKHVEFYNPSEKLTSNILKILKGGDDNDLREKKKAPGILLQEKMPEEMVEAVAATSGEFFIVPGAAYRGQVRHEGKTGIKERLSAWWEGNSPAQARAEAYETEVYEIERLQLYLKDELYGWLASISDSEDDEKTNVDLKQVFGTYLYYELGVNDLNIVESISVEFENWLIVDHAGVYDTIWGIISIAGDRKIDLTNKEFSQLEIKEGAASA